MPIEPPGERAEPEDGAVEKGKALSKSVAPRHVRHLVGDDGIELRVVPFLPANWQQDRRAERAHRDWHGDEFGFGQPWNQGKSTAACAGGELHGHAADRKSGGTLS